MLFPRLINNKIAGIQADSVVFLIYFPLNITQRLKVNKGTTVFVFIPTSLNITRWIFILLFNITI